MILRDNKGRFIKGHVLPEEWKERVTGANIGRKQSDSTKLKRSESFNNALFLYNVW